VQVKVSNRSGFRSAGREGFCSGLKSLAYLGLPPNVEPQPDHSWRIFEVRLLETIALEGSKNNGATAAVTVTAVSSKSSRSAPF